jgi:carboxylesterase type B
MAAKLIHSSLGEIHGRQGEGVTQFLGIKYASFKDSFAPSKVYEHNKSNREIDGTKLG